MCTHSITKGCVLGPSIQCTSTFHILHTLIHLYMYSSNSHWPLLTLSSWRNSTASLSSPLGGTTEGKSPYCHGFWAPGCSSLQRTRLVPRSRGDGTWQGCPILAPSHRSWEMSQGYRCIVTPRVHKRNYIIYMYNVLYPGFESNAQMQPCRDCTCTCKFTSLILHVRMLQKINKNT